MRESNKKNYFTKKSTNAMVEELRISRLKKSRITCELDELEIVLAIESFFL